MVDFRYHLVSIVAVFLALATGIAIGATALNGGVVHNLNGQIRSLISDKDKLRSDYHSIVAQSDDEDSFVKAITPSLVAKQLTGRKVVVIALPGADKASRDQATNTLGLAGAKVVAQIHLADRAIDPENAALIEDVVGRLNDNLPGALHLVLNSGDSYAHLGTLLGDVMLSKSKASSPEQQALDTVLESLHDSGLLDVSGDASIGTLAVVVGSQPTQSSGQRDNLTTALAKKLADMGLGTVVLGPKAAAQAGGSIAAIRGDARTALVVSTVDSAERPTGALALVRALLELLHGRVGQYGTGVGASAVLPSPAS